VNREEQFLAQLPEIERVIRWVCARRCLRGADAEDFASVVKLRIIENDYEVLAKFEGRSSLRTYLTVVVNRIYLDFQIQRFGKWRTSAEAKRLGPTAERLECLLYRDGLTFEEASGVLASDPRVSERRDDLEKICGRLPHRGRRRESAATDPGPPNGVDPPALAIENADRQALADRLFAAVRRSLGGLPPEERLILRLHFAQGLKISEVSRALRLDQKTLYRRRDAVLRDIRSDLEAEGMGAAEAQDLLSNLDWDVAFPIRDEGEEDGE